MSTKELAKILPSEQFLFVGARLVRGGLVASLVLLAVLGFINR